MILGACRVDLNGKDGEWGEEDGQQEEVSCQVHLSLP